VFSPGGRGRADLALRVLSAYHARVQVHAPGLLELGLQAVARAWDEAIQQFLLRSSARQSMAVDRLQVNVRQLREVVDILAGSNSLSVRPSTSNKL
jgi:hypothetical protein